MTRTKWTPKLVKSKMKELGIEGIEDVDEENFKDYARKVRAKLRKLENKEPISRSKPSTSTKSTAKNTKSSRTKWTPKLVKSKMKELGIEGIEDVDEENFKDYAKKVRSKLRKLQDSVPIAQVPKLHSGYKPRSTGKIAVSSSKIDTDIFSYIIDFGSESNYLKFINSPKTKIRGIIKPVKPGVYAVSKQLGDNAIDRGAAKMVKVLEKSAKKELTELEMIRKRQLDAEERKKQRRKQRRKEKKKMQVAGANVKRRSVKID